MAEAAAPAATLSGTPRSAYRVLELRTTVILVAALLALAGIAWWSAIGTSRGMSMMVMGLAQAGMAMPFDVSAPVFLAMWTVMMAAMMLPTIAPILLMHRLVVRRRGEGVAPTVAFGAGYLVVWAAVGLVPLAVLIAFRGIASGAAWVVPVSGAVLVLAGVYQFTRWKEVCQRACQSPLGFVMTHDFGRGLSGAARTGAVHGLFCLGCCWALMAVLFVVGLMNLVWMAGIAAVFLVEKHWRHGLALARVAGVGLVGLGVAVLAQPAVLAFVVH